MSAQRVAQRYAKALVDIAVERQELENVHDDVNGFLDVYKNRDFELLVKSPIINSDKKARIFNAIFEGKVSDLTLKFFHLVLGKGREGVLPAVAKEVITQYKTLKRISTVKLTTASALADSMVSKIKAELEASDLTDENVDLKVAIDENIIGGFILEFEDKLYDASVANRLQQLRKEFSKNVV